MTVKCEMLIDGDAKNMNRISARNTDEGKHESW